MACNKMSFANRKEANECIRKATNMGYARSYECPYCGNWHLTSKNKKRAKSYRKRNKQRSMANG